MPDGSNRHIHEIDNKVFHAGYLENGNNAYLLELPALEKMLNMRKFLMDEMSGQFYAVYGNSYQQMSTKPMLQQAWATGELIDELAATRQAFGYTGLAGSTPPLALGQVTCTFTINNQPFTQSFIVCRHMQQPVILGTDFTSTNFIDIIWTQEGTRKMIRSNGSTVMELPDTTSGIPLVLVRSVKI